MNHDSSPAGGLSGVPHLRRGGASGPTRECLACGEEKAKSEFRRIGHDYSAVCSGCAQLRPDLDTTRSDIRRRGSRRPRRREVNRKWAANNREKHLAHKAVENAIADGKLSRQPCERCGAMGLVHAHHDDYSRPLNVMWLCPIHHAQRHRELRNHD